MTQTKRRVFPGWWVVTGAFLCMLTGYAVAYSFAAFFGALESEFGARRGETALVFSISAFLYFLLGFPAGLIADPAGPPAGRGRRPAADRGRPRRRRAGDESLADLRRLRARCRRGHRPQLRAE